MPPMNLDVYVNSREVIADMDNDIGHLRQGREITRPRRKKDVTNEDLRLECKRKLQDGIYNPWQFLKSISNTIGNIENQDTFSSDSEDGIDESAASGNLCVVCLAPRTEK